MKKKAFAAVFLIFGLTGTTVLCQEVPKFDSAQVNADRTITFRYEDPNAKQVELSTDFALKPLAMTRDEKGLWTITTRPLAPEIYGYSFLVDGRHAFDPEKTDEVLPNLAFHSTSVTVPGDRPEPWEPQNVPHGRLQIVRYTTHLVKGLMADQSEFMVYTPPGYDAEAKVPYPTLYLLHGWSQTDRGWTQDQQADLIMDRLLEDAKARPMVVVMPLGYGEMSFVRQGFGIWHSPDPVNRNTSLFTQVLLTEIMPQVEAGFDVSRRREDRAIAGLSMGGLEALTIGLNNTDKFAYVGGFSGAVHLLKPEQLSLLGGGDAARRANLRLLWVACGQDDSLITANRALVAELKAAGLPVTAVETAGAHVSYVWRGNLVQFVPLLFQKK